MRTSRRGITIGIAGCVIGSTLMMQGASASAASTNSADHQVSDVLSVGIDPNQELLQGFKTWLISQPGIYDAGFVESINYSSSKATTLMWAGSAKQFQDRVIAHGASLGISVNIRPVKNSRTQLEAGVKALYSERSNKQWAPYTISGIAGSDATYDGLTVHVLNNNAKNASTPGQVAAEEVALASVGNQILQENHVDASVRVSIDDRGYTPSNTRSDASPPYYAGGIMSDGLLGYCSSGFAIWIASTSHTTTARHCNAAEYFPPLNGGSYGSEVAVTAQGGAIVMSTTGYHRAFDGAFDNAAGISKEVAGFTDLSVGDTVCASGGFTGVHCGNEVINLSYWWDDGEGLIQNIEAKQTIPDGGGRYVSSGGGDSGGPVMVPFSNGTDVGAAGMIQAGGGDDFDCLYWSLTVCSSQMLFTSMRTIVNDIPNASLRTGDAPE